MRSDSTESRGTLIGFLKTKKSRFYWSVFNPAVAMPRARAREAPVAVAAIVRTAAEGPIGAGDAAEAVVEELRILSSSTVSLHFP